MTFTLPVWLWLTIKVLFAVVALFFVVIVLVFAALGYMVFCSWSDVRFGR